MNPDDHWNDPWTLAGEIIGILVSGLWLPPVLIGYGLYVLLFG